MDKRKNIQVRVNRKIAALVLVCFMGMAAFATLGDGKKAASNGGGRGKSLLSARTATPGTFSLRSGYDYRGSHILNANQPKYVSLNTVVTVQRGNTTYTVPLKKKVLANVKITLGNSSLNLR